MNDNTNKQNVVNAIWQDPTPLFGGQWKQGSNDWTYMGGGEWKQRGAVRLLLSRNRDNIAVFFNHGSGRGGESCDVFAYVEDHDGLDFYGALKRCADIYGINLTLSREQREKINRQALAREVAPSLIEALRLNPDGETGRYLRGRGLNIDQHFGELSEQAINKAREALELRGKAYAADDFKALGLTVENVARGYGLIIPKYNGGIITGLILRNIRERHDGSKYWAAAGVSRGGYCDRLEAGEPVVIVEGEIDAITLMQAGVKNVVAMGGASMNDETARLLKSRYIKDITYIPDLEYNEQGEQRTDLIEQAINKFMAARIDGEPVISNLYVAELYAPENVSLNGLKVDVNDFARANGAAKLAGIVAPDNVTAAWEWEINQLFDWGIAQEPVNISAFQNRFDAIYNRYPNPYERERIKRYIDTHNREAFRQFGITPQALNDRDDWNRGKEYNNTVKALAAELSQAVEQGANPATVGAIVSKLADAQSTNTRDDFQRQLNETFDEELDAIRNQPDTLKTKWQLYKAIPKPTTQNPKNKIAIPCERIEFWPADITVFCAQTSHGKTMILFQAALDLVARTDKTYLFVSAEENKRQLTERAINVFLDIENTESGKTPENGYVFKTGTRKRTIKAVLRNDVPPIEYDVAEHYNALSEKIRRGVKAYGEQVRPRLKLVHTDATMESVKANIIFAVEDLRASGVEVGGVFLDYVQLFSSENKSFSRQHELKYICKILKDCAARLEIPVIVGAQLNRDTLKDGIDNVTLANIGEGADIERIAHDIYFIWQVDKTKKDQYFTGEPPKWNPKEARERANRIFTDIYLHPENRELKEGFLYIEQLKARDGKTGGWGLFPYDGERGSIGENDTAQMLK